jgi:glutaredoxin 3
MAEPEIIIYSTPDCPHCSTAKRYFKSKGLKFTDYDVSKDDARAQEMVQKTGQTAVPVIEINGRIVVGFNRDAVDAALNKQKPPKREDLMNNLLFDPFNL